MKAMQYTLDQLNTVSTDAFVAALSGIFEHSPWVAEIAAHERPFADIDELHRKMSKIVETAFFDWLARKTWGEPTDGDLLAFTLSQSRAA